MPPPKRALRRVAIAFGVFSGLLTAWLLIASLRSVHLQTLSDAYPPILDRSARVAKTTGCALDEIASGAACKSAVAPALRSEEVTFASSIPAKGLAALKGTLTLPAGAPGERRAAVVLLHGSGPEDRHAYEQEDLVSNLSAPFAVLDALRDVFARAGLVVLSYDKRSCVACYPERDKATLKDFSWLDLEVDAKDALAYLATRPEVDPQRLVVVGHSEGAQMAPFVARGRGDVAAVILLAAMTETYDVELLSQLERLSRIRATLWDPIGAWSVKLQKGRFSACFDKLVGPMYRPDEVCIGAGVTQRSLVELIAHQKGTSAALEALTMPVMALQGSVDRNVDPEEIPGPIAAALRGHDHELHYVPGVDDLLVDVLTSSKPPTLDADVARRIRAFVSSVRR
jgi:alpha-beta hydrolase superfamily lysophospholipase